MDYRLISGLILALLFTFRQDAVGQDVYLFGSLHSHSSYSDGNQANDSRYTTAYSCFKYADQRAAQIDFWGISDHNHSGAGMYLPNYHNGVREADSANAEGAFAALYGMEWGIISTGGHVLVYGIDSLIGWNNNNFDIYNAQADYGGLFNKIAARGDGAFACLAHMDNSDYGNILGRPYNAVWDSAIVAMAIRSGPAFSTDTSYSSLSSFDYFDRYRDLLSKGYHVAPVIDHDNHYINFGRSQTGRTVVIVDSLSREEIFRAMRRHRCYASDDWNARVRFTVNGYIMGSYCGGSTAPDIRVEIDDPDNEPVASIKLWYGIPGNGISAAHLVQNSGTDTLRHTHLLSSGSVYYYFAEIVQADGDRIWTAPIRYSYSGDTPPLELLDFRATLLEGNIAELEWATAFEDNLDRYDIEKSTDAITFSVTDQELPAGSPSIISTYTWNDPAALDTATWYRLSIHDLDGQVSLSPTRRLDPNFRSLALHLQGTISGSSGTGCLITNNREEPVSVELYCETGQLVLSTTILTTKGTLELPLPLRNLSRGLYLLRVSNGDLSVSLTERLIRN